MAEKKEYPRKMPLAPVDDAAPSKPRMGPKPTPNMTPKTPKTGGAGRPTPKPTPNMTPKTPKTPPTSDELERRYDKLRQKDLNDASMTGKPTGYKKGGSIDGCAIRGKTRGKIV